MGNRDDQFWAGFLGIDRSEWASTGVSIRAHVGLVGYRGLWCFRRGTRTVVSVPDGWAAPLSNKLERCEPDALFASCAGEIFCLDPKSGAILWHNLLRKMGTGFVSIATEGGSPRTTAVAASAAAAIAAAAASRSAAS